MVTFNSSATIPCRTKSNPPCYNYNFYKDDVVVQKGTQVSVIVTKVPLHVFQKNIRGRGSSAVLNLKIYVLKLFFDLVIDTVNGKYRTYSSYL